MASDGRQGGGWGGWLRRLGRAAAAAPAAEDACSRRAFITGRLLRPLVERLGEPLERAQSAAARALAPASTAAALAIVRTFPVLRPPGAVAEADFLDGCTRCGDCIAACPHGAVRPAPERLRAVAGTPIIDPLQQPCLMCPDTPCITACLPGVLRRQPQEPVPRIGTARILEADCLAHQGGACRACVDACPVPGALGLDARGRPQVAAEACTGCGLCQPACPTARTAVILVPVADRPPAPRAARG